MNQKKPDIDPKNQPLVAHLTELRFRLIRCAWAILVGLLVCFHFSNTIFEWIVAPIKPHLPNEKLIYTAPMEMFMAQIKISFFGGLILVFPFVAYQMWKFIAPGLYSKERKYAVTFVFAGTFLFFLGVVFTYFVVLPMAFGFLMNLGMESAQPTIKVEDYLSFFITTSVAFGAAFEMPLIIVILGLMEVVSKEFLSRNRRYAVMGIAIVCAVITPPDVLSMAMMLVPMWLMFEIAVLIVGLIEKRRQVAVPQ